MKCRREEFEFNRLEEESQKFIKHTEQIRRQNEVENANHAEDILVLEDLINEIKANIKNRSLMLEYEIPLLHVSFNNKNFFSINKI